jgi:ABC-type multidrug transport system permease subunit
MVQLFLVRAREMKREPGVIFWVFGFPILLAVALGLAFRNRPPEIQVVAIVAGEGDAAADAGAAAATTPATAAKRAIDAVAGMRGEIVAAGESQRRLQSGKAVLVVRPGAEPLFTLDPTRPGSRLAEIAVRDALERAGGRVDRLKVREETVTAPGQRYIDFLLPGLLGMNLLSGGVWGVGWALVLMRTRKLLKRFAATPMRRSDLLLSFMLFRIVVSLLEAGFLILFGAVAFGLVPHGFASYVGITVLVVVSALAFSGIGLLIASRAQNSQSAAGLMNLVTLPMFLLSGVFFSAGNFPDWMQPVVKALPLTALNDGLRAVLLDGKPLAGVVLELGILVGWGAGAFLVALKIFRWT